ncbi:MAG: lecithin retinol acyltransferase family protein [Flavipsychrobacter sp.]|nr:lecithin retinol acyltransferase family protein [Flavipsychrobacter sp.]
MTTLDFIRNNHLKVGDKLVREKGILSKHHGIYVGIHNGQPLVAENQVGHGVHYITLSNFLKHDYRNITRIEKFPRSDYHRQQVVSHINSYVGTPYDVLTFNCEHFANLIQYGRAESKQAITALAATLIGLIIVGTYMSSQ